MLPHSTVAVTVILLFGGLFFPALALGHRLRSGVLVLLAVGIVLTLLTIPVDYRLQRFIIGCAAIWIISKLYDLHFAHGKTAALSFTVFVAFLLNPFTLVQRKLKHEPRPRAAANLWQIVHGGIVFSVAFVLTKTIWQADLHSWPFMLEHCVKTFVFMLAILGPVSIGVGAWRLLGGRARNVMEAPIAARTPADFWRRYNRLMGQFLYENVFRPLGGGKAPVRATLLTFAVSGILHEFVFTIVLGQVQGFQLAFFGIQGLAVAATQRVRPVGSQMWMWTAGTLAFNLVSSVLFFASFCQVIPFYSRPLPAVFGI